MRGGESGQSEGRATNASSLHDQTPRATPPRARVRRKIEPSMGGASRPPRNSTAIDEPCAFAAPAAKPTISHSKIPQDKRAEKREKSKQSRTSASMAGAPASAFKRGDLAPQKGSDKCGAKSLRKEKGTRRDEKGMSIDRPQKRGRVDKNRKRHLKRGEATSTNTVEAGGLLAPLCP